MRKRFKIGRRRKRQTAVEPTVEEERELLESEVEANHTASPKRDKKLIHEETLGEPEVTDSLEATVALDVSVDKIAEMFTEVVDPAISSLADGADRDTLEMVREMQEVLDEGVYPYFKQFADLVDRLMGEGE